MSKRLALLSLSLFSYPLLAKDDQYLGKYYDCLRTTNIVSNSVPVFTKIDGKKVRSNYRAGAFTKGIDLSVTTNALGDIETIHIGPKQEITVENFKNGVEFGVINVTAHVLQLKDFDQINGGKIQFGFLKKIGARKTATDISNSGNINEYYSSVYGENWGEFEISLSRDQLTNQWKLLDSNSDPIESIFGILKLKNRFMVDGVTDMLALTSRNAHSAVKVGRYLTIHHEDKQFICEL